MSDDFTVLRTAAARGLVIARLPAALTFASLRAGRLVSMLAEYAAPPTPLHIVHAGGGHTPPRTRAFLDFVEPRLAASMAEVTAA